MYICPKCDSINIQFEDNPHEFFVAVSCLDCLYAWDQKLNEASYDYPAPQLQRKREGNNIHITTGFGEYVLTKNDYRGQKWKLFSLRQIGVNPRNKKRNFIGQFDSLDRIYKLLGQFE